MKILLILVLLIFTSCEEDVVSPSSSGKSNNDASQGVSPDAKVIGNWEVVQYSSIGIDWLAGKEMKLYFGEDGQAILWDHASYATSYDLATYSATTDKIVSLTKGDVYNLNESDKYELDPDVQNSIGLLFTGSMRDSMVFKEDSMIVRVFEGLDNEYLFAAVKTDYDLLAKFEEDTQ